MALSKKFLIAFLAITALMQIGLGGWVLLGLDSLLQQQHMIFSPDLKVFSTYFGLCLWICAALGIVVISYNAKGKPEGLFLSKFIGWYMIIGGFIVYVSIKRMDLAMVDWVRGVLILIAAYATKKNGVNFPSIPVAANAYDSIEIKHL